MEDHMRYSSTASTPIFSLPKSSFSWPIRLPNPIPHRYRTHKLRSKLRSRQSPASSVASVKLSFSPAITLRDLRAYKWSVYDCQYLLLLILLIFALSISPSPGPWLKMGAAALLVTALIIPVTNQFFLPFMPILTWLVFFFSCRFIPSEYRPPIQVKVLPALENVFYGANLSNILSAHQHVILDILAWLPYGIIHFAAPFICSLLMFVFAAPGTVPVFAKSFGYLNLIGVIIELVFPCSPPWYENLYGLAPANYGMQGSPAGLARIDMLFGIDMYTTNFSANSPMVFGAFPSLHAANAVIESLFMSHCFPKLRPLFIGYTMWLWWATMYLSHHYAVDLVGGSLIAGVVFYIAKSNWLPRRQVDKAFRWDYDYIETGTVAPGADGKYEYGLTDLHEFRPRRRSSDAWTIGSSSSVSSGSGDNESESIWEGETLASSDEELNEVVVN